MLATGYLMRAICKVKTIACPWVRPEGLLQVRYNPSMTDIRIDDLVCPVCRQRLTLEKQGSILKCSHCRRCYPVRDDIPVLLESEAVIESD